MRPRAGILASFMILPILLGISTFPGDKRTRFDITVSPTPTYDPLVEPPLPLHPSELELGKNLYWHWCMPCHGDRAQGLSDDFRMIWEPDHQDCWARGCHGGLPRDEGFPIPTVVPALITDDQLAQFESVQDLEDYLEATHPPQSPGILAADQYKAIAGYVFSLNNRPADTPSLIPESTAHAPAAGWQVLPPSSGVLLISILLLAAIFALLLARKENHQRSG